MDENNIEKETAKRIIGELVSGTQTVLDAYDKRNSEVTYVIQRLDNLIVLVNLSDGDIPKELIKTWIDETLEELMKMEGLDPEKIRGKGI